MSRKIVISIIAVAFAIFLGARSWLASDPTLRASGTLEARNISVGSKVGGRVTQVLVAEGDRVEPLGIGQAGEDDVAGVGAGVGQGSRDWDGVQVVQFPVEIARGHRDQSVVRFGQ